MSLGYSTPYSPYKRTRLEYRHPGRVSPHARVNLASRLGLGTTTRRQESSKMGDVGHGRSRSFFRDIRHGTPPGIARLVRDEPPLVTSSNGTYLIGGVVGLTTWADVLFIGAADAITSDMANTVVTYESTSVGPLVNNDYHFVWEGCTAEVVLRNASTSPVRLFLYDQMFHGSSPGFLRSDAALVDPPTPLNCFQQGMLEVQDSTTLSYASKFPIDWQPHMAREYRRNWRPCRIHKVYLEPGEVHIHKIVYYPHRYMSRRYLQQYLANNQYIYLPGFTYGLSVLAMGTPIAGGTVGSTLVTTSAPAVHCVYRFERRYHSVPAVTGRQWTTNPLASVSDRGANDEVNPDTGGVQQATVVPP